MESRWQRLRKEIDAQRCHREHAVASLKASIAQRLKHLSTSRHCSQDAIGWLQHAKTGPFTERVGLMKWADGRDPRGHPAIKLLELEHLEDGAVLTVSIEVERDRLKSYSVSIVGRKRTGDTTSSPFYARIDLDDDPKGHGLCGHPLLHCHVGADPEDRFSPRSPLPWIHPADALDWLLSTVHPALEPRPA